MEPVFQKRFEISALHVDSNGRVKPSVLLYFAQEAACRHCDLLALDWDTLSKQDLFWAIIRHKVQITRLPKEGETVAVETWPMPTTRSAFPRATVGYDAEGKELFRTMALWVLMNTKTRTMVLPGKSGIALEGTLRGTELSVPSSILPKSWENTVSRPVRYTELDRNGHMNNTRYLDWIDDLMPSDFHRDHTIREMTICYLAESWEGQNLNLSWGMLEDGSMQAEASRQNGEKTERVFSARFGY